MASIWSVSGTWPPAPKNLMGNGTYHVNIHVGLLNLLSQTRSQKGNPLGELQRASNPR